MSNILVQYQTMFSLCKYKMKKGRNVEDQNIRNLITYMKIKNNIYIMLEQKSYTCTLRLSLDIKNTDVSTSSFYNAIKSITFKVYIRETQVVESYCCYHLLSE